MSERFVLSVLRAVVIQSLPFTSDSASDRGVFATPPKPGAGCGSGEVLVYCWRVHAATCLCVLAINKSQEVVNVNGEFITILHSDNHHNTPTRFEVEARHFFHEAKGSGGVL